LRVADCELWVVGCTMLGSTSYYFILDLVEWLIRQIIEMISECHDC
jgi:hypothetical protein